MWMRLKQNALVQLGKVTEVITHQTVNSASLVIYGQLREPESLQRLKRPIQ